MSGVNRYWSGDDIADIKNARGCMVPWQKIASHYGTSVEEVQQAVGEPQWKQTPIAADESFDLWSVERLDGVL